MIAGRASSIALALLGLAGPAAAEDPLLELFGTGPGDHYGVALAAIADVDGDGSGDLLVGMYHPTIAAPEYVHLRSGRTGAILRTFSIAPTGSLGFGYAVDAIGDADGDGLQDVAIGMNSAPQIGHTWIFSASTGGLIREFTQPAPIGGFFALAVSAVGDVDGDGKDDVAVGEPAIQLLGGAQRVHLLLPATGASWAAIPGEALDDGTGFSISGAGDVDADGFPDVLVGASWSDVNGTDSGRARIHSGATGALLRAFSGQNPGDRLGVSVAGVGDFDGDGIDDVAVAAPFADGGGTDAGAVLVYSSATGATLQSTFGAPGSLYGGALERGADFDGDGRGDLLVGAPFDSTGGAKSGSLEVRSSATGALLLAVHGQAAGDVLGLAVASLDDVNGDGSPDLAAGVPEWEFDVLPFAPKPGSAVIVSSRCGSAAAVGPACAGGLPTAPSLAAAGCFTPGGSVVLTVQHPQSAALLLMFAAAAPAGVPLPNGCVLGVAFPAVTAAVPLGPSGSLTLHATLPIPAPLGTFDLQGIVVSSSGAYGTTETVAVTID